MKQSVDFNAIFSSFEGRRSDARSGAAAFDFCFNYFQQFKDKKERKPLGIPAISVEAAAQLASYLASWRMYRGSSYISKRSFQVFVPLIQEISKEEWSFLWEIDSMEVLVKHFNEVMQFSQITKQILTDEGKDVDGSITDTLVSKILLGVFGFFPGLDRYFKDGMSNLGYSMNTINPKFIKELQRFRVQNIDIINHRSYKTLDIVTGKETDRSYPFGRMIDIIGFEHGKALSKREKETKS